MIVDSGASDHLIDEELFPTLRKHMSYEGVQEAKGAEDHHDQREQEGIRSSNRHHLEIHHRPGRQACSCSHLGHVRTWTGTQRLLLHQSNAIRGKRYPLDEKPPLAIRQPHFASAHPTPRGQGGMLLQRTWYFFAP